MASILHVGVACKHPARMAALTALHAAVNGNQVEMTQFLLERGADPSIPDNTWDDTPLDWAQWQGNEEIIQMLRDAE